MSTAPPLDRAEYVEQAYFFRAVRERVAQNMPAQEILDAVHQELLSTTRLPWAVQFLSTELKHSGLLASGFQRLSHYFTSYQAFVVDQAEDPAQRFTMPLALLVLEREAEYRAGDMTPAGLFSYQFETLCRNRLGYDAGLAAMAGDPAYNPDWRDYLGLVRRQIGAIDFADLIYLRSEFYVEEERRRDPGYEPPVPPLFGAREGKIAKASRRREPLFLFAALQRQLGYPEVPRNQTRDDSSVKFETLIRKMGEMEARIKLLEGEVKGHVDLSQFGKPELLQNNDDEISLD